MDNLVMESHGNPLYVDGDGGDEVLECEVISWRLLVAHEDDEDPFLVGISLFHDDDWVVVDDSCRSLCCCCVYFLMIARLLESVVEWY